MKRSPRRVQAALSALVFLSGLAIAFSTLSRGIWFDEFVTHVTTARGVSLAEFWTSMSTEQHPLLYYGMVYLAQAAGVTDFATLRSLNMSGVLLVLAAIWRGAHRRAITPTQICIVVALYASSPIFLDSFAELRAYFLVFSAGIALSIAWLIVVRAGAAPEDSRGDLFFYGLCLAIFVNLQYFATLMGGLLTLAMLVDMAAHRRWRRAVTITLISLLAAGPALLLWLVQPEATLMTERLNWISTGRLEGMSRAIEVTRRAAAKNDVALACAIVACLAIAQRWRRWSSAHEIVLLGATIATFFSLMVTVNFVRPIIVDRYLYAGAGSIVLVISLLCTRPGVPALSATAICVVALVVQAYGVRQRQYHGERWRTSARYVAEQIQACPTTVVFVPLARRFSTQISRDPRIFGQDYYAREFNFPLRKANRGDEVAAAGACPSLIWVEHIFELRNLPVDRLLNRFGIIARGPAEVKYVGSGLVITVR